MPEETFPIPLKYIDVMRSTHTDLDVMQEKRINDHWNVDENRRVSDSWKEFIYHRGCSYDHLPILMTRLVAGGKESKAGRQTIFFTPLNPCGDDQDEEEPSEDFSKPSKVNYHSNWNRNQDAVHWIKLSRVHDVGLQFWQTKSNAMIVFDPVPEDCIERIIFEEGDRILFERIPAPRPVPKITLKSRWEASQQQQP